MTTTTEERTRLPARVRAALAAWRRRVFGGDKPYVVGFLVALGFALVVVSGPVQTWADQRDTVERREAVLAVLEDENAELAQRVRDLNDPDTIEAEAREQQGMYRPGEVPYVIIPPPVDQPLLGPDLTDEGIEDPGWFTRLREALAGMFD